MTAAERDALGLVLAAETDLAGAAAVLARMSPGEVLELAAALLSVVPAIRRLRPGVELRQVCRLLLDSPGGTVRPPSP